MKQLPSGNTEEINHTSMNVCHRVRPTWRLIMLGEKGRTTNAEVLRKVGGGLVKTYYRCSHQTTLWGHV